MTTTERRFCPSEVEWVKTGGGRAWEEQCAAKRRKVSNRKRENKRRRRTFESKHRLPLPSFRCSSTTAGLHRHRHRQRHHCRRSRRQHRQRPSHRHRLSEPAPIRLSSLLLFLFPNPIRRPPLIPPLLRSSLPPSPSCSGAPSAFQRCDPRARLEEVHYARSERRFGGGGAGS